MNAPKSGPLTAVKSALAPSPKPKTVIPGNSVDNLPAGAREAGPGNVIGMLLADKRSPQTRKAYEADLRHFFGGAATPEAVAAFLALPATGVAQRLVVYKAQMLEASLAEATVNRRLSAIRSLLKFAYRLGFSQTNGDKLVDTERVKRYRDTRGIDVKLMKQLVAAPGTADLRGIRDTAILRLMFDLALRRAEVCSLRVRDFEPGAKRLMVIGKGRGTQKEPLTLSPKVVATIKAYLAIAGHGEDADGPLFRNLSHRPEHAGGGLTGDGLHEIVRGYGRKIGIPNLAPHKLRHSAITAALDATNGDVRTVQGFSRHADLNTLMLYDDRRVDRQGEVANIVSKLV